MIYSNRQQGFTLLEIMVALTIMAFSLAALWQGLGQSVVLGQKLPERVTARWVAQNRLLLRQAQSEWPPTRTFKGVERMGGREWFWQEKVEATEQALLRRITVEVSTGVKSPPIYNLEGYVARPRAPRSS